MKEELDQILKNETWELISKLENKNVIGTKWVFRNKMNEQGEVVRIKARLVCKVVQENLHKEIFHFISTCTYVHHALG